MISFSLHYASVSTTLEDGTVVPDNSFYLLKNINFSGSAVFVGFCVPSSSYDLQFEGEIDSFYCTLDKEKFLSIGHSFISFSSSSEDEFSFSVSPSASNKLFELILLKNSSSSGNSSTSVDLTSVLNSITALNSKLDNLDLLKLKTFDYLDLNGNCGTFPNGTTVTVLGQSGKYKVVNSSFTWDNTTNRNSMVVYTLESENGKMMKAPDPLVSLPTVTAEAS